MRHLNQRGHWRGEGTAKRKDGSKVSIEAVTAAIRDPHGQITGYLGIHRDITARKGAEEQLRYHASLLDNVGDALIATDADNFRITAWNRGAERLYGFSAEEVLGRPAREVARYPGDQSRPTLERELLETGRRRLEFAARRKDGSAIEVELTAVAVKDERGETSGYWGIHRDITEQKRAAERLAYHASLLENLDDAVLATDTEFVLTTWNRRAEQMFGWTAAEALGQKVHELIGNDWTDAELAPRLRRLAEGRKARTTGRWYGKGGNPVPAESLTIALRSEDDRVTGYLSIMRDISALQESERELERRLNQQAAVAEFGLMALEEGHLHTVVNAAVTLVSRTLGVEYAKVDELMPDRQKLLVRAGTGWGEGIVGSYWMRAGRLSSPAGYALALAQPVIVENVATETRFEIPELLREHDVVSDITVVIDPSGDPFGTLAVLSTRPRAFSEHDVGFVQSVANVIGAAVDRTRVDERIEATRRAERTRIARDLHDEALRELSDALALATMGRSGAAGERQWRKVISTVQRAAQQLRGAIYDLGLSGDDDRPFGDLLSELTAVQDDMSGDCRIRFRAGRRSGPVLRAPGCRGFARRHRGARQRASPLGRHDDHRQRGCIDRRCPAAPGGRRRGLAGSRVRSAHPGGERDREHVSPSRCAGREALDRGPGWRWHDRLAGASRPWTPWLSEPRPSSKNNTGPAIPGISANWVVGLAPKPSSQSPNSRKTAPRGVVCWLLGATFSNPRCGRGRSGPLPRRGGARPEGVGVRCGGGHRRRPGYRAQGSCSLA